MVGNQVTTKTDPSGLEESTIIDIPVQAGVGVLQGGANIVNGLQDTVVGLGNLVIGIPNATASGVYWLNGTDQGQQIKIPYIPSPDWSKDLIVQESSGCHNISKFAGAGGVEILTGAWITKVSKARAAAALAAEGAGTMTAGSTGAATLGEIAPSVADDAIINLGTKARNLVSPHGGRSYWFRFGDVRHLTPDQVRTLIGQMASAGTKEGSRVIRVGATKADECEKVQGVAGYFEYISKVPVKVVENIPVP